MTYRDGYIYGCATKHNGSGTSVDDYPGNAVLFVYDVAAMKVVATYDLSLGIPGLTEPITAIDLVFEDPEEPGKFWGVVSDTLFSFTFDHTTKLFHVTMELSLGRSEYVGVTWGGRDIIFDGDFMYVPFGTKGLYMIERANPTNYYRLTTVVPYKMVMPTDGNIYYIDYIENDQDLKVLHTAQVTANIKAADAVRAQIAAIGTVTLESEAAITAARSAYNALTADQKAFVKNLDVLTVAEAALAQAQAGAKSVAGTAMTLGNSLSMDFVVAVADAENGYYARITRGDTTQTVPKSAWKSYDKDGNYLYFSYTGFVGVALTLENQILLDFGFHFADYTGLTAVDTYTDHYGNKKTVEFSQSDFKEFDGGRYLSVSGLAVADWQTVVTCTVYNGQEEVATVSDSVESYVNRQTEKEALTDIVGAIAKFGQSACAYFHQVKE